MFPYCKLNKDELTEYLKNVSAENVRNSLEKSNPSFTDFINMLSPAASDAIPEMREIATRLRMSHFGKTVRLYAPLYISNYCTNNCEYCAFRSKFHFPRRRLSIDEVVSEAMIIRSYGITSLLLVSGEDPKEISVDFLVEAAKRLREHFSYISIEVYPMKADEYKRLFEAGIHGLTVYQETYDRDLYLKLHHGPKKDYDFRLDAVTRGAGAGFYNVGIGALLGLSEWRTEAVSVAAHGLWLRKKYWKTRVQFSFPRITPVEGKFEVPSPVSEQDLEQIMLAFRIFFPESDMFISTRETLDFRKRIIQSCASHMSAGSKVSPGGYSAAEEEDLGQFSVRDCNSVDFIEKEIESVGLEAVFKDWDTCLGWEKIS